MADLITLTQVREVCGVGTDIIPDQTITDLIPIIQERAISYFNIAITPTKYVEIKNGNNNNTITIDRPYIWKVLDITSQSTSLDLSGVILNPTAGTITMSNIYDPFIFSSYKNAVSVKYLSAFMDYTITITETTADAAIGSNISVTVDSNTGYTAGDWIMIEGTDGYREAAQIVSVSGSTIIVLDQLVQTHATGSLITLLQTHPLFVQFCLYETSIAAAISAVGSSYTFASSYSVPEYTVTKGMLYMHLQKNIDSNILIRDTIKKQIFNKIGGLS